MVCIILSRVNPSAIINSWFYINACTYDINDTVVGPPYFVNHKSFQISEFVWINRAHRFTSNTVDLL